MFPLLLKPGRSLLNPHETDRPHPNVSTEAADYLVDMRTDAAALFYHVLAVLYAPAYAVENASGLRNDWPRIPLPETKDVLVASAARGRELAALLGPENPVPKWAKRLNSIGPITAAEGRLDPDAGDLEITVGWGHAGKGGVTMPGTGKVTVRRTTSAELQAIAGVAIETLGDQTCDVWLNDRAYWRNIPLRVWEYTLGGYPVIKKWLSYRESKLLGRSLSVEEARYVTEMARRIAAILLLSPVLDANYSAAKHATYDLSSPAKR